MAVVSLKNKVKSRSMLAGNPQGTAPIPGYSLWLDASDASTFSYSSGTRVSEWRDKSGNGHHFAQTTAASQPNRNSTQNGRDAVRMASGGVPYFLSQTSLGDWSGSAFTVLAVVRYGAGAYAALLGRNSVGALQVGAGGNGLTISISRIGQATAESNLTQANATTTSQVTYKSAGVSAGSITVQPYQNKTAASSTLTLSISSAGNSNFIGASNNSGADYFGNDGFLCELIVYRTQLSDYDRLSVENYLITKWGL